MTREEEEALRAREAVKSRNGLSALSPRHPMEEREHSFADPKHHKVSKL